MFDRGYRTLEKGVSERTFVTSTAGHLGIVIDRQVTPSEAPPAETPDDAVEWNLQNASALYPRRKRLVADRGGR